MEKQYARKKKTEHTKWKTNTQNKKTNIQRIFKKT